jgi:hypothetical protein
MPKADRRQVALFSFVAHKTPNHEHFVSWSDVVLLNVALRAERSIADAAICYLWPKVKRARSKVVAVRVMNPVVL